MRRLKCVIGVGLAVAIALMNGCAPKVTNSKTPIQVTKKPPSSKAKASPTPTDYYDDFMPPMLFESHSPRGSGTVDILELPAFHDSSDYFYVRDPVRNANQPRFIGGPYSTDGSAVAREVVWSRDGSVAAVRAEVGHFGDSDKIQGIYFVDAYDFKRHASVSGSWTASENSPIIKTLLKQRGGAGRGRPITYDMKSVLNRAQAKPFKIGSLPGTNLPEYADPEK